MKLHCPLCGHALARWHPPKSLELLRPTPEYYVCINTACPVGNEPDRLDTEDPVYWVLHSPFGGLDTPPGDSFSLSWIK